MQGTRSTRYYSQATERETKKEKSKSERERRAGTRTRPGVVVRVIQEPRFSRQVERVERVQGNLAVDMCSRAGIPTVTADQVPILVVYS